MRKPRIVGQRETNYYHVMSRVVNKDRIFGNEEKEFFRKSMRRLEQFMGLHILTYCIMSNHFHILVEVPNQGVLSDDQLLKRLEQFYSKAQFTQLLQEYKCIKESNNELDRKRFRERYVGRMGHLSIFLKELKESFSKWYNRKSHRRGTLWEERFKSVLVEDSEDALSTMAAYIDLNPVRAGIVKDPKDYRFCGYADAVAGNKTAQMGIITLLQMHGQCDDWRLISKAYRCHLYASGRVNNETSDFDAKKVKQILESGGALSRGELLRCHIRYFNDGIALGSRLFLEEVFAQHRSLFSERRKDGARSMRGGGWGTLYSLRQLAREPVTVPS